MSHLILYSYFRSSASFRVRIALHLKALDFEYIPVHLVKNGGSQHSENYRKLNPFGEVPTLVDGELVISQSMAIIQYLEDKIKSPSLFGKNFGEKAKIIEFCEIINSGIQPLQNLKVGQFLDKEFHLSESQRSEWTKHWIKNGLDTLEKKLSLSAQKYCFGNSVCAADCFLVPQVFSSERFGVNTKQFPLIHSIYENCMNLSAFINASPAKQIDTEPA